MNHPDPVEVRTLVPAYLPGQEESRVACADDGHPPTTYNPWQDRTYCRCGSHLYAGDIDRGWGR